MPQAAHASQERFRTSAAAWAAHAVDMAPAPSTKRAYDAAIIEYRAVGVQMGCIHPVHADFYPPAPFLLLAFVYHLVNVKGLSVATAKSRISAVRGLALMMGLPDCFDASGRMPRSLKMALLGAERERAVDPSKTTLQREPATASTMRILLARAGAILGAFDAARFCAMIIMAYMGAFCMGDMLAQTIKGFDPTLHLCRTDVNNVVQFLPDREATVIRVAIKTSKTDRARKGCVVDLVDQPGDMSMRDALAKWAAQRLAHEQPGWSPVMFVNARGAPMTTRSFRVELAKVTTAIENLPAGIKGHSFRKGAATVLKAQGFSDTTVAAAGRWASNCFLDYISPIAEKQDEMFAALAASAF